MHLDAWVGPNGQLAVMLTDGSGNILPGTTTGLQVDVRRLNGTSINLGSGTIASATQRVVEGGSATATRTQVADTDSDTLILAANTSRVGATVQNDSSATLFLGLGTATVTATDYTVKLVQNAYYEVPSKFNGQIRGIWASDPGDGAARITELT